MARSSPFHQPVTVFPADDDVDDVLDVLWDKFCREFGHDDECVECGGRRDDHAAVLNPIWGARVECIDDDEEDE